MPNVSKDDFERLHDKVDGNAESLARIEGKIDGMAQQKKNDWQGLGIIGAIAIGVWNMIVK